MNHHLLPTSPIASPSPFAISQAESSTTNSHPPSPETSPQRPQPPATEESPRGEILHTIERWDGKPLDSDELAAAREAVLEVLRYTGSCNDYDETSAWCNKLGERYPIVYALDWISIDDGYADEQLVKFNVADYHFRLAPPLERRLQYPRGPVEELRL